MTKTINITQETLDSLPSGEHTLEVTATNDGGFSSSDTATFTTVSNPTITIPDDLGSVSSEFTFEMTLEGINGTATVYGSINNANFYQLNFATDGKYTVTISDNTLYSMGGGEHDVVFTLTDSKTKRATATSKFNKTYTKPIVSVPTNMGDRIASFSIPYTIKNARSEHPSLVAYMDTVTEVIYQTDDASTVSR